MTTSSWGRRAIVLAVTALTAALSALVAPSPASADALRPLTVTLTCTNNGQFGLPYGYQITTGSGLYYPPARSDATVSGGGVGRCSSSHARSWARSVPAGGAKHEPRANVSAAS